MPDKKYTEDEVEIKTQIARLEENVNFLIKEWTFSKRIFWSFFAPVISVMSAIGGFAATIYAKGNFFNHSN